MHREEAGWRAAWGEPDLTAEEREWDAVWEPSLFTDLYSALFSAIPQFDQCGPPLEAYRAQHPSMTPARHAESRAVLQWCGTLPPMAVVQYLHTLGIEADGQPLQVQALSETFAVIRTIKGATAELHARPACVQCRPQQFGVSRP